MQGEAPLSRQLTTRIIEELRAADGLERAANRLATLSRREREVLALTAEGFTNRQIARRLVISLPTVKRHVQNVLAKLEVASRQQAAQLYAELGLAEREDQIRGAVVTGVRGAAGK